MAVEKKVKVTVVSSKCPHYKVGDAIYVDGPFLDKARSDEVCLSAVSGLYHFIYAARKGVSGEDMGFPDMIFQCADIPEAVEFKIEVEDEG